MFLLPEDITAIVLTLKLAAVSTVILLFIGLPLAWWLARTSNRIKLIIETLIALPLILPPTVIGFYLLLAFSPDNWLASHWQQWFGTSLAFSFSGLVVGSVIYSLPFVVQPMQSSYERIPKLTLLTAASLGANKVDQFFSILLPMTKPDIAISSLAFSSIILSKLFKLTKFFGSESIKKLSFIFVKKSGVLLILSTAIKVKSSF